MSNTRITLVAGGADESDHYVVEPLTASDNKPAYVAGRIYLEDMREGSMWFHVYRERVAGSYPLGSTKTLKEALALLAWGGDLNLNVNK